MSYPLLIAAVSENAKLGPGVASTYRPVGDTCPHCPLVDHCYAKRGNVARAAVRSRGRHDLLDELLGSPYVRHLVSGDLFRRSRSGARIVDRPFVRDLIAHHERNPRVIGWLYTHGWLQVERAGFAPDAWPSNLRCLASVDDLAEARAAQAHGWTTARVTDDLGDRQRGEFVCPYDSAKREQRGKAKRINCISCRACFEGSARNILFLRF